ncbi:Transcription factor LHW [Dendrobium catenatum]|uniref:Transcription factor LHW n=1 Tax=Dendrobium catenatum TaxID=906689 RepID=A0A2I0VXM0_9ASPA|nr:Transcription factor LHW [Dendrobium catenatum]
MAGALSRHTLCPQEWERMILKFEWQRPLRSTRQPVAIEMPPEEAVEEVGGTSMTRLKRKLSLYLKVQSRDSGSFRRGRPIWPEKSSVGSVAKVGGHTAHSGATIAVIHDEPVFQIPKCECSIFCSMDWIFQSSMDLMLVLEESYHEEQSGKIFEKVVNQVHVIGQGTIGEVAISGNHRWIIFDTICMESSETSSTNNPVIFQGRAEWQDQILAGIKTIAVIPLPSLGVLQVGSTRKIGESSDFIAQAQHLFWQFRIKQRRCLLEDMNFSHPQTTFDSVISPRDYSHDSICEQRQDNHLSSEFASLASGLLSSSQTSSLKPHAFSMPESISSGPFNGHRNLCNGIPSFSSTSHQVIDQQGTSTKVPILLPPSNWEQHSNFKSNMWAEDIDSSSYMENNLFPTMAIPGVFNVIPTTLHSSIPHSNAFHFLSKNSVLSHSKVGSKPMAHVNMSSKHSEPSLSDAGMLLELQRCSSPPVSVCDISTSKYSSKVFPFTVDLPENFLPSQDRNPENSTLTHSMNNPIYSCKQTNDQCNDGLSVPFMYSFPDVPIASSGMAGNVSRIACSMTATLPTTEIPAVCVASSLDRNCNWNVSEDQLVSEKDLFDGMELNLIPMISRQECWDEIALPVVSNGCTDFISELEVSSVAGSGKGLLTDSGSFEQLLDAVVTGNANISVGCNSVAIEKTMQGPLLDKQSNSNFYTWIDDTCSVNAEGSALHQPKKLEEYTKVVRKRARPGESARPRPKDRQQIQDRVKELREIVPNGAKCSIDSLLDRTIKHMLFLQSVTKYMDKLKQADEPKLIREKNGVVLKDNTNGVGGATWAYEVAGQTMACPILVEDVYSSGQMLVEMLCEEGGFFLEIADVVRGFGLTILKGDMEIRERKVWARFLVEVIDQIL